MRAPTPLAKIHIFRQSAFALAWACSLAGAVASPIAHAQERDNPLALLYGDEETVSIATGTQKPLRHAPSVATVITAEDIRRMGALTLEEVLTAVPGVHVSLSSRYSSLISIRGIHTRLNPQVLMLIDGYPISELFTGSRAPTFRMPLKNVERVEVIRGPGSAVYGADAFAGVINIITKSPANMAAFEAGAVGGSFDTHGGWIQASGEWLGWTMGLSIEELESEGDRDRVITADLQSTLDAVLGTGASKAPGPASTHYDITSAQLTAARPHWELSLNRWTQKRGGIGAGVAEALDPDGYQDVQQDLLRIGFDSESRLDHWRFMANYNAFRLEQQSHYTIFPQEAVLPIGSDGNLDFNLSSGPSLVQFPHGLRAEPGGIDRSTALEFAAFYDGFASHRLRIATGYKSQDLNTFESKNFGPGVIDGTQPVAGGALVDVSNTEFIYMQDESRHLKFVSLQDEWLFYKDWELTAGVRLDDYSDFSSTINPRLALVWHTSYQLTSKLLYGHAFRAPSFSEQFSINNPVTVGNPEVDPEEIDTVELVFDYRPSYDFDSKLSLFHYLIEGLIDYVDADDLPGGSSLAQNVHDQEGYGLELETSWRITDRFSLKGSYSLQQSENLSNGHSVPDAPQRLAYLDASWRMTPYLFLSSQVRHVGERSRAAFDSREEVGDYTLLDVAVRSENLFQFADFVLSVDNLLGKDAREPSVGPGPSIPHDHPLESRRILLEAVFRIH